MQICVWNIEKQCEPDIVFSDAHVEQINDVKFSSHAAHDGNLMLSTSDDAHFKIWDLRQSTKKFTLACKGADDGESLCVGQFNPLNEHLFAIAGASNGEVQIWDMRMPQEAINCLLHHSNQVCVLEWCPNSENILATGSDDNHIYIWDQAQCGSE